MNSNKVPVSVITGFLGAGKTTLLNQLLQNQDGIKYAIIVNEFGEIGIDNNLVVGADEEIFELNNGCVCCNVRGDLIRIIQALFKRKNSFDAILIETTGLANPAPVAQTFFADDDIARRAKLDGIICVADAINILNNIKEFEEAQNQIAFADLVILNKSSLVNDLELQKIRNAIKSINSGVKIIVTDHSKINSKDILNLNSYDGQDFSSLQKYFEESNESHNHHEHSHDCHDENCGHEHHHHHHHHKHENHIEQSGVRATIIENSNAIIESEFVGFLSRLIENFGEQLLRFKGIVKIKGANRPYFFNGVHMMVDADYMVTGKIDENFTSKLVFIGKNLPEDNIKNWFEECVKKSS